MVCEDCIFYGLGEAKVDDQMHARRNIVAASGQRQLKHLARAKARGKEYFLPPFFLSS